jgi:membrane associated rhomboid family serine protease
VRRPGYILGAVPFRFPRLTATVKKLLIVLAAAFVSVAVLQNIAGVPVFEWLALSLHFELNLLWQPFTYWLVYPPQEGALFNFLFVLLGIYFFLSPFEEAFGAKRALQLAASGVLAAALATVALAFAIAPVRPIFGAASIALAALGAFPIIARDREILFMFVLPMKAWTVIALGLGIAALSAVLARDPFVFAEHAAALGGGFGFAKWITRPRISKTKKAPPKRRRSGPDLKVLRGGSDDDDPPRWLN